MAWWHSASRSRRTAEAPALLEQLEGRQLLYTGPMFTSMPALSLLEDKFDTVVRMVTNFGNIDIELYDTAAPKTVANFKNYINKGSYEESFFHRLVKDFVLQGGGYTFSDADQLDELVQDAEIKNEFSKSNKARTLGMAKFPGDPDSATSQWFINLKDNGGQPPNGLDFQNGGFTVFGKVVQGWNVVTTIAALGTEDLDARLDDNQHPGLFTDVPVTSKFKKDGTFTEDMLVRLLDIETIKPYGTGNYFTQAVYYPEGFRGNKIIERVDLENLAATNSNFMVIVRYDSGLLRDKVIAQGILGGNKRMSVKISDFNDPSKALVKPGVGYAIEIRSTKPVIAALNHRDTGVLLGESFLQTTGFTEGALQTWHFADGQKGANFRGYLLWQNLTDKVITVTANFYPEAGTLKTFTKKIEPFRRGGFTIQDLAALPDGPFSVRINATAPIIAAFSQYKTVGETTNGGTSAGVAVGGRSEGFLAAARIPTTGKASVSAVYTAASPTVIILRFFFLMQDGSVKQSNPQVITISSPATRRFDLDLANAGVALPKNQFFSIRYAVDGATGPVSCSYVCEQAGDTMSTPFSIVSTQNLHFADGYLDPAKAGTSYSEIISILNPYAGATTFNYSVKFKFSDGVVLVGKTGSLGKLGRIDIRPQDLANVLAKIKSNAKFQFYSISIETTQKNGNNAFVGAAIAQLTRIHGSLGTMTSQPGLDPTKPLIFMDDPQFN